MSDSLKRPISIKLEDNEQQPGTIEGSQNNHNHNHNNSSFTDIINGQHYLQQTQKRPRLGDRSIKQEEGELFEDCKEREEEKEKETDFHLRDELLQKIANLEMQLDQRSRQIEMYENIHNSINVEIKRLTDEIHTLNREKCVLKQENHDLSEKFEKERNSTLQENNSVKSENKKLQSENDFLIQENKNLIQLLQSRQSLNQPQNMTSSEKQTNSGNSDETNNNSIEQLSLKIEKLKSEELPKAIEALDKKWEERLNDQKEELLQEMKKVGHEKADNQKQTTANTDNQAKAEMAKKKRKEKKLKASAHENTGNQALSLKTTYGSLLKRKGLTTKFLFHEFDSKKIIIATSDEGIKYINLNNGEVTSSVGQRKASFSFIAVTRFNGTRVLATGNEEDKNMIELWSMENCELRTSFRCLEQTTISDIKAYEHNGKNMLACVGHSTVELWDLESQKMTRKIHGQGGKLYIVDILRYKKDGKLYIVLMDKAKTNNLLEIKCLDDDESNFNRMKTIDVKKRKASKPCVFEFDNDIILAMSANQCIIFLRMSDLEQYHVLDYPRHVLSMESLTLDDGRVLIMISDSVGTVSFFDVAEKKLIYHQRAPLEHKLIQTYIYKDVDDKFAMVASSKKPQGQLSLLDVDIEALQK